MNTCIFILTLNEEKILHQCIESALTTDFPVYILDSGSDDSTLDIARNFGVKAIENIQSGRYSAAVQRNFALKIASQMGFDKVFFIDADEIIPPEVKGSIQSVLAKYHTYDVISIPLKYYLYETFVRSQGYPNYHDRIIRVDQKFFADVGEHIRTSNRVFVDQIFLKHFFNSRGIQQLVSKSARYANYIGEELFKYRNGDISEYYGKEDGNAALKRLAARFLWARPFLRFLWNYIWKRGFLEGRSGLILALHNAHLEFIIVIKYIELKRLSDEKRL